MTERQCGTCSMCCKLLIIPEIDKPGNQWCRDCTPGRGCNIYKTRPQVCRDFQCQWLRNPQLGEEWKPNVCGMMIYVDDGNICRVMVDPGKPDIWREPDRLKVIMAIAAAPGGHRTVIQRGQRIWEAVPPDKLIEVA
jgi:hypothetical protein